MADLPLVSIVQRIETHDKSIQHRYGYAHKTGFYKGKLSCCKHSKINYETNLRIPKRHRGNRGGIIVGCSRRQYSFSVASQQKMSLYADARKTCLPINWQKNVRGGNASKIFE
ncbi:hypothetical protein Zmor_015229 [Zophobas morio]|uniref:Uncharacterized protein n=1 Tax=Zophobas morio TaxID=2755281 RepID=A0AA38IJ21_9CUCU|nr:hypothetical protein Zmor_015229 [Zophobas morio]